MDRKKEAELPKMQVGFINAICMPLYEVGHTVLNQYIKIVSVCVCVCV